MKFIKNLFNKNEVENQEEFNEVVEQKEKKRTMPEVNGKELYRLEKEKRRAKAQAEREAKEKQAEIERKERLEAIKLEEEEKRKEREAKKMAIAAKKTPKVETVVKSNQEEDNKLDLFGFEVELLKHHMIVDVEVLNIDNSNYYVRVEGNYQEAIMPRTETTKEFAIGDKTTVVVYKYYAEEYYVSQKRVEQKAKLAELEAKYQKDQLVNGQVVAYNAPFFKVVLTDGQEAQVHQSKIDLIFVDGTNSDNYINNHYDFVINNKKVVKNNLRLELNRSSLLKNKQEELFANYQINDRITIESVTPNRGGLKFMIDGIDGFIPLSEVSHYFYKDSNAAYEDLTTDLVNFEAVIIEKREKNQPTLICSIKKTQQSPWEFIQENYHEGDELTREIEQKKDYGLFFEIDAKIKGLLHKNEMSTALLEEFDNVTTGDTVTFIIKEIDTENNRIALTNIQE